jgi:drug/metabolite transporter (DMT)-like permease
MPFFFLSLFQQLVASSTHLFAKHITETLHPAVIVFYRGALSVIAYLLWFSFRNSTINRIEKSDWLLIALLGVINIPMNQLMFVWGLKYTTAPNASLAYALSPAFVLLISYFINHERLSFLKTFGIVIALCGTVIVLTERGIAFGSDLFLGNVIELGASISWSFYTVLGRKAALKYGAVYSTALSMGLGFIVFSAFMTFLPIPLVPVTLLSADQVVSLMYLGVITSGLGFALWYYMLTKYEAPKVAVFNNLQPVLTTILSFLVAGNIPSTTFVVGGVIVITGVIMTQRG